MKCSYTSNCACRGNISVNDVVPDCHFGGQCQHQFEKLPAHDLALFIRAINKLFWSGIYTVPHESAEGVAVAWLSEISDAGIKGIEYKDGFFQSKGS